MIDESKGFALVRTFDATARKSGKHGQTPTLQPSGGIHAKRAPLEKLSTSTHGWVAATRTRW